MATDNRNLLPEPPEPQVPLIECPCCTQGIAADELSIWGMRLSVRTYNVLANADIKNAAEVARMSKPEILCLRGAGKEVAGNILRAVDALGLSQYRQDWQDWKRAMYLYQETKVSKSPGGHRQ